MGQSNTAEMASLLTPKSRRMEQDPSSLRKESAAVTERTLRLLGINKLGTMYTTRARQPDS